MKIFSENPKYVYHSIHLPETRQKLCRFIPDLGSANILYQRMSMGLNINPFIWQSYINAILGGLQNKKHFQAIMNGLLIHSSRWSHMSHLEESVEILT